MLIDQENITRFIPQRAPFVMIDSLVRADETGFETQFEVRNENLFLEDDTLSESALIENIAQTCAAGFGYVNSQKGEGEGKLGFIGAVSRLTVQQLPKNGAQISTSVEILNTFDNIHLIQGTARSNGANLLECQMKIVIA